MNRFLVLLSAASSEEHLVAIRTSEWSTVVPPNERSVRVLRVLTCKQKLSHIVNTETEDLSDEQYARV